MRRTILAVAALLVAAPALAQIQSREGIDLQNQILELRQELRGGAPIEIGALAGVFHVGEPDHELPRGTVSGSPEKIAENLSELIDMGVSHLQMRFSNRSLQELCDQIAAFGEQVGPLLSR